MMWLIRAGKDAVYYDVFMNSQKVYLPWCGFNLDLSSFTNPKEFRTVVEKEKENSNRTSISNWAGQLYSFVRRIQIGDYVLIPTKGSHCYCLSAIIGNYQYSDGNTNGLCHSRSIQILQRNIPKSIFPQAIIYSLGAYRTLFSVHHEETVKQLIEQWVTDQGSK